MQYDNNNSGALFKNDRKTTANHPDYRGEINVNGQVFWLSAWIKPLKADPTKRYMSLSVQPKEQQAPRQAAPQQTSRAANSGFDDTTDDIPPF